MIQYKYVAINKLNKKMKGYYLSENEQSLALDLSKQGLYLVSYKVYSGKSPSAFFTLGTGKVGLSELTIFTRQYSIMLNSGISILGCLEILKYQKFSQYFKSLLSIICDDVKGGMMLSDAMGKHKKVFPDFYLSMIQVGERSGKLDIVMNSLAEYYEKDMALKKKVKAAFAYPIFLLVLLLGIILLMMLYIVPTFRSNLSALNITPTGLTKLIYDSSDFLKENWMIIVSMTTIFFVILFFIGRTEKGKYFYDYLKLHIPGFKRLYTNMVTSKFARGFGLLLSSGMSVNDALDSVVVLLGNKDAEKRFRFAADDIKNGLSLSIAFGNYNLFPAIMNQMIEVGEKTAQLDDILFRSCLFYDNEVESSLTSLTSKIQPIMLIILGGIIGVMFIGVYSPMLDIMNGLV